MIIKTVKGKLLSNISFGILIFGAGSNFVLTLLVKKFFNQDDFNNYSLFLTYIGIVSSFGLIGFDQIFLRLSTIKNKRVYLKHDILFYLITVSFTVPLILSFYFFSKNSSINFYQFIMTGIGINLIILTYHFFRLVNDFNKSQMFKNGFKIFTLIFTVISVLLFNIKISLQIIIDFMTVTIFMFAIWGLWFLYKNIEVEVKRTNNLLNFFLSFCINLAIITTLSFGERIIILDHISENDFGKYFYYSTIFLFPLTLIQQYVGFKELVGFKKKVDKTVVDIKIKQILYLGISVIVFIFLFAFIDNGFFLQVNFKKDYLLTIALSVLGLVKLFYGLFSALIGAVGNTKEIYMLNVFTLVLMLISVLYLFQIKLNLISIVISLILIFLLRSLYIYYYYVFKAK